MLKRITKYSEYFGFTDDEVQALIKQFNIDKTMSEVRSWYNGYQVDQHILYNPWSIMRFLQSRGVLEPYWVNRQAANSQDNFLTDLLSAASNQPSY